MDLSMGLIYPVFTWMPGEFLQVIQVFVAFVWDVFTNYLFFFFNEKSN